VVAFLPDRDGGFFVLPQTSLRMRTRAEVALEQRRVPVSVVVSARWRGCMRFGMETLVDDVMRESPATIRVFLDFKMKCVGCPIGCFHTVQDACREHGVDGAGFLAALQAIASN
jgi:hybrid cluster-associated redox disulfide protein